MSIVREAIIIIINIVKLTHVYSLIVKSLNYGIGSVLQLGEGV